MVGVVERSEENPKAKASSNRERGASMIEYALLVALLCVVAIGGVRAVGASVNDTFTKANAVVGAGGIIDPSVTPAEPD